MIQILQDKFTIEIKSHDPIEDVCYLKHALLDVLEQAAIASEIIKLDDNVYLTNIYNLLKELEYDPEQLEKAIKQGSWQENESGENIVKKEFKNELYNEMVERNKGLEEVITLKQEIIKQMKEQIEILEKRLETKPKS